MSKCLLLADDNALTRGLVRDLLATRNDWEICAEAADGDEAVEKAKTSHPDLAILDIAMPRLNGVKAASQIVESCPETVVHTAVTKLLEQGTPIAVVAHILVRSASTAVRVAKRYGHIRPDAQSQALDAFATAEIQSGVNQIVHQAGNAIEFQRPN